MSKYQIQNQFQFENIFGSRARVKILKVLARNIELSISQLIKQTSLNYNSVINHTKLLKKLNLIQEKKFGRIRIFRFKEENIKARSLKKFIEIWENSNY